MASCLVLSCLVSFECTLWEGFFWRMPKQAYTVPCRASHPHGQGAQVLSSYFMLTSPPPHAGADALFCSPLSLLLSSQPHFSPKSHEHIIPPLPLLPFCLSPSPSPSPFTSLRRRRRLLLESLLPHRRRNPRIFGNALLLLLHELMRELVIKLCCSATPSTCGSAPAPTSCAGSTWSSQLERRAAPHRRRREGWRG